MLFSKIIFLGAHPDDEFGCSGTLCRFVEEKRDVYYATFSLCEESVPRGFPRDVLRSECEKAAKKIGVKKENFFLYPFKVRHFPTHRQEILEVLIQLRNNIMPDLVLVPALSDMHQDHQVIAREALRAFKHCSILGYELPMNTVTFQHSCFIKLAERHVRKKIEIFKCYKSQMSKPYTSSEFIRGLALVRGVQIGEKLAEAFEVLRLKIS